ncbi:MAG: citrate/2-methylcitrate synthase, partial [Pirellulaceae bacterium]|nr:citrate/2-methylcitrate synthase [Pirellulaceae bacterium]
MSDISYRPGLEGVSAGETAICSIDDGLRYRGYAIEDLAANASFADVAFLLLRGELPSEDDRREFHQELARFAAQTPNEVLEIVHGAPAAAPLMDVIRSGASLLAHWAPDEGGDDDMQTHLRESTRLLAQLPVVLAAAYRGRRGLPRVDADAELPFAENFLTMLHDTKPTERAVQALDVTLILYAEHEFNASTFTARVVCSTLSDVYSSITAAIGALKGPLHGGANERVMALLEEVGSPENAEPWIRNALANKQRIMGFGHRVYKSGDPRADYLAPLCAELAKESGNEHTEEIAGTIERIIRAEKKLPPNLDWPSARIYAYLGLP